MTERKMTSGSITKTLLLFSLPIMVGQLLQQLYNIVDTIIVGRCLGVNALAAVGATWSLNYIIVYFCIGTCMGIGIPIAQQYGANNEHKLRCYFANGIYVAVVMAIVMTVGTSLLCGTFLTALGTPTEIMQQAYDYLIIIFIGLPATILYNLCFGILMAFSDGKRTSIYMAVSTVINLVLDLFFILILKWGIGGAAGATVLSQLIAGIMSAVYLYRNYGILQPNRDERQFRLEVVGDIVKMSVPMGLQYSIVAIGAVIMQASVNALGALAIAGFSAGSKIKGLLMCPLMAVGTALSSYVGQNYGAHDLIRIRKGIRSGIVMGWIYCAVAVIVVAFTGPAFATLFVDSGETEVIQYTTQFENYISYFSCIMAVLFSVRYAVQGMGYGKYSLISGMAEMAARTLAAIFMVPQWGYWAVCISEGLTFFAGILVITPIYFYIIRKTKNQWKRNDEFSRIND